MYVLSFSQLAWFSEDADLTFRIFADLNLFIKLGCQMFLMLELAPTISGHPCASLWSPNTNTTVFGSNQVHKTVSDDPKLYDAPIHTCCQRLPFFSFILENQENSQTTQVVVRTPLNTELGVQIRAVSSEQLLYLFSPITDAPQRYSTSCAFWNYAITPHWGSTRILNSLPFIIINVDRQSIYVLAS